MVRFTRHQRRRWSLPLVVVLLLHSVFGFCEAMTNVLCLEPGGTMVVEHAGEPCASDVLEQELGEPCLDISLDAHDDHATSRLTSPVSVDLQPLFLPTLAYLPWQARSAGMNRPSAAGPPPTPHSVLIRKTTVLLI
ncbi:MAG: hypothetical protein K0Q68_3284 [Moraxellaceae bacterium]|jgi:hypothetical protein|nr:hypothetical protein [Moraxellaceae bacterium]